MTFECKANDNLTFLHLFQKLENFLRNILSKRPLSEMKQTIYRCINCLTQFSRETNRRSNGLKCPNCKGQYFVEIKEEKPSSPKQPSRESSAEVSVDKSDSQSISKCAQNE